MSNKNKLVQFEQLHHFDNVFEHIDWLSDEVKINKTKQLVLKHHWAEYFNNNQPITLELACGKGEYTLALAEAHPELNFVGIDLKGNRLWHGAKKAQEKGLKNVAFLRCQLLHIARFFNPQSVAEIWITFADPYPNASDEKRRLTSPRFFDFYKQIILPNANFHLKHDNPEYIKYTRGSIELSYGTELEYIENVHDGNCNNPLLTEIKTFYEHDHLSKNRTIGYLRWRL
jgi:tRNA (guanine-N7-)-methyltransferase